MVQIVVDRNRMLAIMAKSKEDSPIIQGRDIIADFLQVPTPLIKNPAQLASTRALVLEDKGIGDFQALSIAEALRAGSMPRLEWLRLAHNSIGNLGFEALVVGITGYYEDLIHHFKNMVYVHDGIVIDIQGLEGLKRTGAPSIFFLLHLDCSFNYIQAPGIVTLAAAIEKGLLSHLINLNLNNNSIGVDGVQALSKAFECCQLQRLEKLSLAHNGLGEQGIVALTSAISAGYLPSLLDLDLRTNKIGEQGAIRLANMLKSGHPPRQKLDMTGNRVGKKGAQAFVDAFKLNPGLETEVLLEWISFQIERKAGIYRLRNTLFLRRFQVLMYEEESEVIRGKVIICGSADVGKTTLRKSLEVGETTLKKSLQRGMTFLSRIGRDPYSLFQWKQRSSAKGIEVGYIDNIDEDEDDEYTLSTIKMWDLAGQSDLQVMHSRFLHDFLLAERKTLTFVVVCKAEINEAGQVISRDSEHELHYWLCFIASSAVDGMKRNVVVVLNCYDADVTVNLKEDHEWVKLISRMHVKFQDALEIHPEPFAIDAQSSDSVQNLKWHLIDHTNGILQGQGLDMTRGLTEPTICQVLRDKVNRWASKSSKRPVMTWAKLKRKFHRIGFAPRELRAAAEYLEEVGEIILFCEAGSLPSDEDDSSRRLVLSSEWFWGTIVKKLLMPEEFMTASLKKMMEEKGHARTEHLLACLRHISVTDPQNKQMPAEDALSVLMRLGLCYKAGPERLIIPALLAEGHAGKIAWWDAVGAQCVLGRSYKLMDNERTALPLPLFYQLQMELALDPTFGGHADSEFHASKTHVTCKCLCMALLVECFIDENDPRNDRIDILVKPLVERRDIAHGRAWRDQQIQLIECVYDQLQHLSVRLFPRVEFTDYILQPWKASIGTVPMPDRNAEIAVEDLKRLVFEDGPNRSKGPRWRLTEGIFGDEELLSGSELQEIQVLVDDQCYLAKQAMVDLELCSSHVLEEKVLLVDEVPESPVAKLDRSGSMSFSSPSFASGVHESQSCWSRDMDNRKIIELAQNMPELRIELAKAFQKRSHLIAQIQALKRCPLEEKENSVPKFMYIAPPSFTTSGPLYYKEADGNPAELYTMHFLCEIQHKSRGIAHEVRGQKGMPVDISHSRNWLRKVSPYLKWSLIVLNLLATLGGLVVHEKLHFIPPHADWQVGRLADRISTQVYNLMRHLQLGPEDPEEDNCGHQRSVSCPEFAELGSLPLKMEDSPAPINFKDILLEALQHDMLDIDFSSGPSIKHASAIHKRFGLRPALAIDLCSPCNRGNCNDQSVIWICDECSKHFAHEIHLLS